ncbi:hypothetical protein BO94DRAFT_512511 [Aspergillus sclerotioniger CBS 115572]|uniref:Uncharacterized protein n=1 Tax=Aspergillus sclerotioniger CBS 115572 TaxID=1450535 RepID=A0A317X726_9EURO|nr:hypothetical protein BO94DRAFT_512511 [Aspergillus sclerotioniger CBS 115572]PWY93357.1 hypothetical protein BO94DRAFT_512511 [Aspergillus sclerotioniger CBS 115572]
MPRPPTKRNRLTSKAPLAVEQIHQQGLERHGITSTDNPKSPTDTNQDIGGSYQRVSSAQVSDIRRQLKNQTPMARAQDHAIESSPMGERGATGSRPFTRARGYSSTISVVGRKGDTASKVPGTPAFENSMLSNFRRRPRQPSILQMMQADDGSSDLDDDVFLGSLSPEDESTPLNLSRGRPLLVRQAASPSPSLPTSSGGASRKRKLSTEELQVPRSDPEVMEHCPATSPTSHHWQNGPDVFVDYLQALNSPSAFSQTLAPPMSSSPPLSPIHTASMPEMAQPKRKDKPAELATSKKMNLPTATLQDKLLPRRNRPQRKHFGLNDSEAPKDFSDGDRSATGHDDDDDDDELYYLPFKRPPRAQRKQANKNNPAKSTMTALAMQDTADSVGGQTMDGQNSPMQPVVTARQPQQYVNGDKKKMTSGPASLQTMNLDREVQPVDTSPLSSPLSSPPDSEASATESTPVSTLDSHFLSEELRLQAKKFADIDKWQLDFEDVVPDS